MIFQSIFVTTIVVTIFCLSKHTKIEAKSDDTIGFTVDLIHRDSPQSPTYDPSLTPLQLLNNALKRSFNRMLHFQKGDSIGTPVTDIISSNGEYLMKYSVGTPPIPTLGIADTGDDVTWTQCLPCKKCFKQKLPLFDPKKSSTYKAIPCNSPKCTTTSDTTCNNRTKTCNYSVTYGDGSFTYGDLAMDTITLGSTTTEKVSIPDVTLGCGHNNGGIFSGGESGIVGLGAGNSSLISQLGTSIQGKFSYCLVSGLSNAKNSSKLNFGNNAVVSGREVVSTPIVFKKPVSFYYLTLKGVSVGKQRLELQDSFSVSKTDSTKGNIIIDTGTTITFLPEDFYNRVKDALIRRIKLKRTTDPTKILDLCYLTKKDIEVSDIVFHFEGANVNLRTENVFARISDTLVCVAFLPTQDLPIYGNLAQMDFLIGYDLQKMTLSFKPTDCSK